MQRWAIISLSGVGCLLGLVVWREWAHATARQAWATESGQLQTELSGVRLELENSLAAHAECEALMEELEARATSLGDRATNLEAQRNHLRAENERQSERARLAEHLVEEMRGELEAARQRMLELSAQPRVLQARLDKAGDRIEELEESLDREAGRQSLYPEPLDIEGVARDGTVIALSGPLPEAGTLPLPVYVCQKDSIRLEGWINRVENGVAIGHVERWRAPASTLVKGEKVFILPRYRYEADN